MTATLDRRQMILTRLEVLLSGLSVTLSTGAIAAGSIVHNRNQLPKEKVPGIILLDADEVRDPRFPNIPGRPGPTSPGYMRMTPEVYVVLDVRGPNNEMMGEDLNTARTAIVALVLGDQDLQTLTGSGGITYDSCVTDMARNRTMKGQMGLAFTFGYPFIPGEFKQV